MSRFFDTMELEAGVEDTERACRLAISKAGWRILAQESGRLVAKEVVPAVTQWTWPAKVEIIIHGDGHGSRVELRGSIAGMGPIQKNHLKGQIGALKNDIQLTAMSGAPTMTSNGPAAELAAALERLVNLRASGALSQEEFALAKARLLET